MFASFEFSEPSDAINVKLSSPKYPMEGEYVNEPVFSLVIFTLPLVGDSTIVYVNKSPSTSYAFKLP